MLLMTSPSMSDPDSNFKCHNRCMLLIIAILANGVLVISGLTGCGEFAESREAIFRPEIGVTSDLAGEIKIEGSSTVEPISIVAAQQFNQRHPRVNLLISGKGTSNGFAALAKQEIDIANASRPIRASELEDCRQRGIAVFELPVAYDGITVVVNPQNDFIKQLSIEELTLIFREDQATEYWSEIDPTWPQQRIMIYAAGIASGTHDYFANVISGDSGKRIRSDDQVLLSEDDRLLVRAIRDDPFSIGFFGFHYYWMEQDSLRAVKIVNPEGNPVAPTLRSITSGQYVPFSRPLYLVANLESCQRLEVFEFFDFFLSRGRQLVQQAGYVPFEDVDYARARAAFQQRFYHQNAASLQRDY